MQVPPFSLSQQLAELGPELDAAVLQVLRSGQYIGGGANFAFFNALVTEVCGAAFIDLLARRTGQNDV